MSAFNEEQQTDYWRFVDLMGLNFFELESFNNENNRPIENFKLKWINCNHQNRKEWINQDIYYIKFPKIIERNSVVTSKFPVKNLQRFNNRLATHIKYSHDINEYIGRQFETLKIEIISILKIWSGIKILNLMIHGCERPHADV